MVHESTVYREILITVGLWPKSEVMLCWSLKKSTGSSYVFNPVEAAKEWIRSISGNDKPVDMVETEVWGEEVKEKITIYFGWFKSIKNWGWDGITRIHNKLTPAGKNIIRSVSQ